VFGHPKCGQKSNNLFWQSFGHIFFPLFWLRYTELLVELSMARIRKEKRGTHVTKDLSSSSHYGAKGSGGKKNGISKEQILALGGDEQDYDLVKNVEDAGSAEEDVRTLSYYFLQQTECSQPALSKDVSKFLKGLKLDGTQPDASDVQRVDKVSKKSGTSKSSVAVHPKQPKADNAQHPSNKLEMARILKPDTATPESKPPKPNFIVEPTSQWYTAHPSLASASTPTPVLTAAKLASLTTHAAALHAGTIATYQSQSSSTATNTTSDFSFLQKILQSGTLSDRLSALTLLVQSSPVHNVKALETLKGMAERGKGKGGREECLKALRCVVDWWVGGGVPNRKLKCVTPSRLSGVAANELCFVDIFVISL
jgi:ribosome biogenesis protein MAK21